MRHARLATIMYNASLERGTNFKTTSIALSLKYIGGIFMHNTRYIINDACGYSVIGTISPAVRTKNLGRIKDDINGASRRE